VNPQVWQVDNGLPRANRHRCAQAASTTSNQAASLSHLLQPDQRQGLGSGERRAETSENNTTGHCGATLQVYSKPWQWTGVMVRLKGWIRWCQQLEVRVGELLPDQPVPLLKHRRELSRKAAITLWNDKRKAGWASCGPRW